jgi:glycosyltransferase involved in cell wall biosynthesis
VHKVLHLLNYLGNGGSEKYIYSLAERLHGKTCEFYIAYSEDGPGRKAFEELGISLLPLKMGSPFDIKAAVRLKEICRSLSIETVHTHFLRENYIGAISKILGNDVRLINTRHMLLDNSRMVVLANRIFTGFNYRIIAVSRHVEESLVREGIGRDRISMIYNGVDPDQWSGHGGYGHAESFFRKQMGIAGDEIVITSVSRFSPEKGHAFIIEVIKYFIDNLQKYSLPGMKCRFVLAAEGPLFGEIKEKVKEYGLDDSIIFAGYVDDVKELLKSSDIFIAHSKSEAFGIAILEAMASGLPVITTDSGGTAEIVNEEYGNGILVDYGDVKGYADSIALLVKDEGLRRRCAENGLKAVRSHFSLDNTANQTYNLYVENKENRKEERRKE